MYKDDNILQNNSMKYLGLLSLALFGNRACQITRTQWTEEHAGCTKPNHFVQFELIYK